MPLVADPSAEVERVYVSSADAVAEVSHEQRVSERPEAGGSERQSPRRVKRASGNQAPLESADGVVNVDKAVTRAGHIIVLGAVLQSVSDVKLPAQILNVEW